MLEILSFSDWGRVSPPSTEISLLTFVVNKMYNEAFSLRYLFLQNRQENVKLNVVLVVVLVLESRALTLICSGLHVLKNYLGTNL